MAKHFVFPNFTTPLTGSIRGVLYNDTSTRDKIPINGLGMTKGESVIVYIMLKTGTEVAQDRTFFNKVPSIPQKDVKFQYRTIVAGTGVNLAQIFFSRGKVNIDLESYPPKIH